MVANEVVMRIRTVYRGDKATRNTLRHLKQMQKEQQQINRIAMQTGVAAKTVEKAFKKAKDEARRFRSEFLSLMFFGMAMERVFGGLLRASFQTFNKMTEGTNKASHAANRMIAAWEFFKFSLFDALLRSNLFQMLVDSVVALADWFSNLSDETQELIAKTMLWGMILGAILTVVGTLAMGFAAISSVFGLLGKIVSFVGAVIAYFLGPKAVDKLSGVWTRFTGWFRALWAGALAFLSRGFWSNLASIGRFLLRWVGVALRLVGRFALGIWGFVAWAIHKIVGLWGGWGDFIRAFARGSILVIAATADQWIERFSVAFDFITDGLISLINILRRMAQAYDAIRGTNIASMLPSGDEIRRAGNVLRNMRGSQIERALEFTSKGWFADLPTADSWSEFRESLDKNTEELKEANKVQQIPGLYSPANGSVASSPTNIYVDEITMPNMSDPVKFAEDMNEMAKFWASRFGQAEFND